MTNFKTDESSFVSDGDTVVINPFIWTGLRLHRPVAVVVRVPPRLAAHPVLHHRVVLAQGGVGRRVRLRLVDLHPVAVVERHLDVHRDRQSAEGGHHHPEGLDHLRHPENLVDPLRQVV